MLKYHKNDVTWEWNVWNNGVLKVSLANEAQITRTSQTSAHHSLKCVQWIISLWTACFFIQDVQGFRDEMVLEKHAMKFHQIFL